MRYHRAMTVLASPTPHQQRAHDLFVRLTVMTGVHTQAIATAVGRRLCWEDIPVKGWSRAQKPGDHLLDIRITEVLEVDHALVDAVGIHADWEALSAAHGIQQTTWNIKSQCSFDPQDNQWLGARARPQLSATIRLLASILAPEDRLQLQAAVPAPTPNQARAQLFFETLSDRPDLAVGHHASIVSRQLRAEGIKAEVEYRLLSSKAGGFYVEMLALEGVLIDGSGAYADWEPRRRELVRSLAPSLVNSNDGWRDSPRGGFDPCDDATLGPDILPMVAAGQALLCARLQEQGLEINTPAVSESSRVAPRL